MRSSVSNSWYTSSPDMIIVSFFAAVSAALGRRASNDWLSNGGPDRLRDALSLATGRRRATVRECAIIQGFPLDYEFFGTVEEQYTQVGNAVPPALAEAVARAGLASLGGR